MISLTSRSKTLHFKLLEPAVWDDLKRLLNDQKYRQVIFESKDSSYQISWVIRTARKKSSADCAGTFAFRNLCFFSMNQPLVVYFAINHREALNEIYRNYLSDATGRGQFTSIEKLKSSIGSYAFMTLLLPIGTIQTKNILTAPFK